MNSLYSEIHQPIYYRNGFNNIYGYRIIRKGSNSQCFCNKSSVCSLRWDNECNGKKFLKELFIKQNKVDRRIICDIHDFEYVQNIFKRAIVFLEYYKISNDNLYEKDIKDEEFLREDSIK